MRLALIGRSISHSRSPAIYRKWLGSTLVYDLLDFPTPHDLPSLEYLSQNYDGINITSPYKEYFFQNVLIEDEAIKNLGAINTLAFNSRGVLGTNTDLLAVRYLMAKLKLQFPKLNILLLAGGAMARVTIQVCKELDLSLIQLTRKNTSDFDQIDLSAFHIKEHQTLIINACSRDYVFRGNLIGDEIFWDYNYSFMPHQNSLPFRVKEYQDGQELLMLQAEYALQFWEQNKD
jgi:shikimate dehydrogenase